MSGPSFEDEFEDSSEMSYPNQLDNIDWGKRTKLVRRKVTIASTGKDGTVYGSRIIMTKENKLTFKEHLLAEKEDVSLLPQRCLDDIKKNIRDGAKDLTQMWKDALELVHTAYHVANIRRPVPDEKGAWKQYEEMIRYGVKQLAATRGLDGPWRTSDAIVSEKFLDYDAAAQKLQQPQKAPLSSYAQHSDNDIGSKRFFVEIPGQSAAEIDAQNMDEIIEMLSNKLRRHGAKIRVEERTKNYTIITVWVQDVKRDRIIIKQVS